MFTFSFSSAFAMTNFDGSTYPAMEIGDYDYATAVSNGVKGSVGITDAERDAYVADLEDALAELDDTAKYNGKIYCGAYLTNVENYLKEALEAAKVVSTSYGLNEIKVALKAKVDSVTIAGALLSDLRTAYSGGADYTFNLALESGTYLLPGYGYFSTGTPVTVVDVSSIRYVDVLKWMLDNGFDTKAKIESTAAKAAFEKALVKVSATTGKTAYSAPDTNTDAGMVPVYYEWVGLVTKLNQAVVTDLDTVVAADDAITDFEDKYGTASDGTYSGVAYAVADRTAKVNAAHAYYVATNLAKENDAVKALKASEYVASKDKIVALAKAVKAYEDKYDVTTGYSYTNELTAIEAAGDDALAQAKAALAGKAPQSLVVADKTKFDAFVTAYDAYKAEFNDSVYENIVTDVTIANEAYILAGKANLEYLAGDVDSSKTKLQNYLNNATLKVTTTALGNNKIRVQAKFDTDTYRDIVAQLEDGYTISYKFYHRADKATTYKAAKEKDRNYITYTSKSLKKGTKYKFRCEVIVKDAKGNVVATKDYKASTIGSRVCR